jgi:hypothetical protein
MDDPSGAPLCLCGSVNGATETAQMHIDIDQLSGQELTELHHKIVERLKFLESMRAHADMMAFTIGETVAFSPPGWDDHGYVSEVQ